MQVIDCQMAGPAPVEHITLKLTGDEYDTVLRSLRRMQVRKPTSANATMTYAHKRRAEHLHRELTGKAR